jgi:hypothetical protein
LVAIPSTAFDLVTDPETAKANHPEIFAVLVAIPSTSFDLVTLVFDNGYGKRRLKTVSQFPQRPLISCSEIGHKYLLPLGGDVAIPSMAFDLVTGLPEEDHNDAPERAVAIPSTAFDLVTLAFDPSRACRRRPAAIPSTVFHLVISTPTFPL